MWVVDRTKKNGRDLTATFLQHSNIGYTTGYFERVTTHVAIRKQYCIFLNYLSPLKHHDSNITKFGQLNSTLSREILDPNRTKKLDDSYSITQQES